MGAIYLTPSSIGFLAQLLLCMQITAVLVVRLTRQKKGEHQAQTRLLVAFFASLTVFVGLMFMDVSLLPTPRLYVVYLENTVLALALALMLQFCYHMPMRFLKTRLEARIVLGISLGYLLFEAAFAVHRFTLLQHGTVVFRPGWVDAILALLFAWVPLVLFRQAAWVDDRRVSWFRKLWKPAEAGGRAARDFALIYLLALGLNIVHLLSSLSSFPTVIYNAALSIGLLIILWAFVTVYLHYLPEGSSFLVRIVGICVTLLLVLLGLSAWVLAPGQRSAFQAQISDRQSLHFSPNAAGGYDVVKIPFLFETDLGEELELIPTGGRSGQSVPFIFPFYGSDYTEVYITSFGVISMGEALQFRDLQHNTGETPAIIPLLVDLDAARGGVYARSEPGRLTVTWNALPALQQRQSVYTFQVVLYPDGSFDFTYNGLPTPLVYDPDAAPTASPWLRGATPGLHDATAFVQDLPPAGDIGVQGVLQDFYMEYRAVLHGSQVMLAVMLLLGTLIMILGLPLLLRPGLLNPLNALLAGVRQMNDGSLDVHVPVRAKDEIGIVTEAFNNMAASLRLLVNGLEAGVAERTRELEETNARLRLEMAGRELAQNEIVDQQRSLTALEERERMGRDLHDGLGQMLGYIGVQAQAAQSLLADGQAPAAQEGLESLLQTVRSAHLNLRSFILGLRDQPEEGANLFVMLRATLKEFTRNTGVQATISLPAEVTLPAFSPAVEEQLLHIVQEALTNVRKHAAAHRMEILFSFDLRQVTMVITDDGEGFDPERLARKQPTGDAVKDVHFGLEMMRERVEMIGGRMEIHAALEEGTRLMFFIPRLQAVEFSSGERSRKTIHGMRILLVDDSPIFLEGLRNLLMARGLTIIGMAADGVEAQEKARLLHPDVIIMDVNMPRCDGLEATRRIKAEFPEIKIVMLTVTEDDRTLFEAIRSGASGYLLKNLDANEFSRLLAGLTREEAPLTPRLAARLLDEFAHPSQQQGDGSSPVQQLSKRQFQILELAAGGMTYKEIAGVQKISEVTVKYHMRIILERLQVDTRAQAIELFRRYAAGRDR